MTIINQFWNTASGSYFTSSLIKNDFTLTYQIIQTMRAIAMRLILAIGYFCLFGVSTLFAAPVNDDPCNATSLTLTETCTFGTYDNNLATASAGPTAPGCGSYSGGDVWFSVEMPNNGYHIKIEMQSGTLTDMAMAVYGGADCNSLSLVSCDANSGLAGMPTLMIDDGCLFANANATFWIRVWDEGGNENGDFGICVSAVTPAVGGNPGGCGTDPVTGDFCCDAILLTDNLDGYCGNTGGFSASIDSIPGFCATIDNDSWLSFIAAETDVEIGIEHSNCLSDSSFGIQAILYETADCVNYNMVSNDCWNPGPGGASSGSLVANNLTPGETYYIMIDGWAGDICDYSLSMISGVFTSSATTSASPICSGQSATLMANVYGVGPYTYAWSPAGSLDDATLQSPVATPSTTTTYTVTITSATESITKFVQVVVDLAVPGNGSINGPTSVCENSTGVLYDAISSNATNYSWTVTGGATIVGATSGSTLTVDWGTSGGMICMIAGNECGDAPQACINVTAVAAPEISATNPPNGCAPGCVNLVSSGISNNTGGIGILSFFNTYTEAINGVGQLPSPIVCVAGTYWVRMDTGLDCFDVTDVGVTIEDPQIITVDPQPVCFPETVNLDTDVFKNETEGWPGGTYTYFSDSLSAVNETGELTNIDIGVSNIYWVRYETPTGCSDVAGVEITIEEAPDLSIPLPLYICEGDCAELTTASIVDANNATIVAKKYFLTASFAALGWAALELNPTCVFTEGTYYTRWETAAGCWDTTQIQVISIPAPTASISGGASLCSGADGTLTFTMTGTGLFDIVYNNSTTSSNVTLTGISSPHTQDVTINANTDYTIVSVSDNGACPGTFSGTASFTTITAPTFSISGDATICNGENTQITFNLTGGGLFDIVYNDGSAVTLNGIADGHAITVSPTANTTYTPVSITDANGCNGTVSTGATVSIVAGITIQNLQETCTAINTEFVVTFQLTGGNPASYQVTGGGSFDFGSNIFTSNSLPTGSSYQFLVSDANCGPIEVNGVHACECDTEVGAMGNSTEFVCESGTATLDYDNGEFLDANDVLWFVLHNSSGPSLGADQIWSTTPEFTFGSPLIFGQTYYVSAVVASDDGTGAPDLSDPCRAISNGQSVTFYQETEVAVSAPAVICEGDATQLIFSFTGGSTYNVEYHDSEGNDYELLGVSDGHAVDITPTGAIIYTIDQVSNTGIPFCNGDVPIAGKSVTINLSQQPTVINKIEDCDNVNVNYTVVFEINGGVPSGYSVTGGGGGTLAGSVFTSNPISEGTTYSFTVSDGACPPFDVTGMKECDCLTAVGSMLTTGLQLCDDATAFAVYDNTDENLDPDDVLGFILHDDAGAPLGNILQMNSVPEFNYSTTTTPPMNYGQTYYISAVVGNDDGTGFPVLDQALDACLGISQSQPVSFYASTEVSIAGSSSICVGETVDIVFTFNTPDNTPGTFDVEYSDGTSTLNLSDISSGYIFTVSPQQTTTYTLLSVMNHDAPFCPGVVAPSGNTVTVDISEGPVVSNMVFTCDDESINYVLTFDIAGGNIANYNVTGLNGILIGNTFASEPMLGGTNYDFEVTDGGPCPTEENGQYACLCLPDMAVNLTIDEPIGCGGETDGVVSATNFSGTGPFAFAWSNGSVGEQVNNLSLGWHYVTMTDTYGCTDVDSVFMDGPMPITASLAFTDPLCYEGDDGSISVENISGGSGNYDISLNELASFQNNVFTGVGAGRYVVSIEDGKGCVWTDSVLISEPDQFMVTTAEDMTIQLGDSVELEVFANADLDTFYWSPQLPSRCETCFSQYVHPLQETIFTVNAVSTDGCMASDRFSVIVTKENLIYIPNAFSPNGDGTNDLFSLYPSASIRSIKKFNIYTRWGAQLYQNENFLPSLDDMGWDGYFKGREMPSGAYVYFAEIELVDGTTEMVRGDVTLVR
jgi:gliding motility-associated-like protein